MGSAIEVVRFILDLGAVVVLPIIIILLGVIFGMSFSRAFRSGIMVGVGFLGIFLILGLLLDSLGSVAQEMVQNYGLSLEVVDVGWPLAQEMSLALPFVPAIFGAVLILNLVLLVLGRTSTLNLDLWSYWSFSLAGTLAYALSKSYVVGLLVALATAAIIFLLADRSAPLVKDFFGLEGVSLPHTATVGWFPLTMALNWLLERIPGIKRIHLDLEGMKKRLGVWGEPVVIGLLLGVVLAILARAPLFFEDVGANVAFTLLLGMQMAAVIVLLPRMVEVLKEGLLPLVQEIRAFLARKFPGRKIYLGLDASLALGHPAVLILGLLMVPLTLLLALGLGALGVNRMLPFADLALLPFFMIWCVAPHGGNLFRALLIGVVIMGLILFISTDLAPLFKETGEMAGLSFPEGYGEVSSLDAGSHVVPWLLLKVISPFYGFD
ncbi:PTS system, galactitol-specific IIC component [Candidatus Hakubella thermalkaliphila]|nr:PTS system, galactitol-specific IIC component [Candidatus Hakubella thermalkaliphila]